MTDDIPPQDRIQAHPQTRRAARLLHRDYRDRARPFVAVLDAFKTVFHRRRDSRAQPRHVLRVRIARASNPAPSTRAKIASSISPLRARNRPTTTPTSLAIC